MISMRLPENAGHWKTQCMIEPRLGFMCRERNAILILPKQSISESLTDIITTISYWIGASGLPLCTLRLISPKDSGAFLCRVQRKSAAELLGEEALRGKSYMEVQEALDALGVEAPLGYFEGEPAVYWDANKWSYFLMSSTKSMGL